jgi:acetyl-CoA carboxylase biotin carboxyl carrier protein
LGSWHGKAAQGADDQPSDGDAEDQKEHPGSLTRQRRTVNLARSPMTEVRAEITANVWQVNAEVGQQVAEGDTVAILESMKMEIPVESPVAGTVVEIKVAANDQVQEGDLIAVIE